MFVCAHAVSTSTCALSCSVYLYSIVKLKVDNTVRVENFEVVLISRFSWVADDTKIIHVEGGINTREMF